MGSRCRIAVVDDDRRMLVLYGSILEPEFEVVPHQAAESCLPDLMAVDLLITDLQMPGLGGRELVRRLRTMGLEMPVLVVTGMAADESFRRQLEESGEEVLAKPFLVSDLLDRVRRLLGLPEGMGLRDSDEP